MIITLSFLAFWLGLLSESPVAASDQRSDELFAAGIIEPSENTLQLMKRMSLGRRAETPVPLAHQETLDQALVDREWRSLDEGLKTLYREAGPDAVLDWLISRHAAGYLGASMNYVGYSQAIGESRGDDELKAESVTLWFYVYAATLVDGAKCVEVESPPKFLDQITGQFRETRQFAAMLSERELRDTQELAMSLEEAIAPNRRTDPTICRATPLSMEKYLENLIDQTVEGEWDDAEFDVVEESENKVTLMSRESVIPDFDPAIKRAELWLDEAARRRKALPDAMEKFAEALGK